MMDKRFHHLLLSGGFVCLPHTIIFTLFVVISSLYILF